MPDASFEQIARWIKEGNDALHIHGKWPEDVKHLYAVGSEARRYWLWGWHGWLHPPANARRENNA